MIKSSEYWDAIFAEKAFKDDVFHPEYPSATPFPEQLAFLMDDSLTKLARCGNRSAKTFTECRDVSWKMMYRNPYVPKWFCETEAEYMQKKPRVTWFVAPDLAFIYSVIWKQYLEVMIPQWYYTNDDLVPMIQMGKEQGKDAIYKITFRNGDVIEFKAYSQNLLSKMGRAVDDVYLDEAPPDLNILVELATRVLDKGGMFVMGFTPVNVDQDIIDYVENHPTLSQHRWGMLANPVFRDNPVKYARAIAEYSHLPSHVRDMRLNGDWCIEETGDRVFENVYPMEVADFPIPDNWRHVRLLDPASHCTGAAWFAEDPETGDWYCYRSLEIEWKGKIAKATDIEAEADRFAPHASYRYFLSMYDNAAAWFAAHSEGKHGDWIPCVQKNKELLISMTRDAVVSGRVKFFKEGAAPLTRQFMTYKRKDDGTIRKVRDHMVDCLQYFCRQIPEPDPDWEGDKLQEHDRINQHWMKQQEKEWVSNRDMSATNDFTAWANNTGIKNSHMVAMRGRR